MRLSRQTPGRIGGTVKRSRKRAGPRDVAHLFCAGDLLPRSAHPVALRRVPPAVLGETPVPVLGRRLPGRPRLLGALLPGARAERRRHRRRLRDDPAAVLGPRPVRRRLPRPLAAADDPRGQQPRPRRPAGPRRRPRRARQRRAAVLRPGPGRLLGQPVPAGRPLRVPAARRRPRPAGDRELGRPHLRLDRLPLRSGRRRCTPCAHRLGSRGDRHGLGALPVVVGRRHAPAVPRTRPRGGRRRRPRGSRQRRQGARRRRHGTCRDWPGWPSPSSPRPGSPTG